MGTNLHDRIEDQLTSDIFGSARYLPTTWFLWQLLSGARYVTTIGPGIVRVDGPSLQDWADCPTSIEGVTPSVMFWPTLAHSEPDVVVPWDTPPGRLLVVVEVKWASEKSGDGVVTDYDNVVLVDQLGREYGDLLALMEPRDTGAVVYLTADRTPPTGALASSLTMISSQPRTGLFWLSWQDIYAAVRQELRAANPPPHARILLADMQALLERKGLAGFRAWRECLPVDRPVIQAWGYVRHPREAQRTYTWAIHSSRLQRRCGRRSEGFSWHRATVVSVIPFQYRPTARGE